MTDFSKVDPVMSGVAYVVQAVNGCAPTALSDFSPGQVVTFTAAHGEHIREVCGSVRSDADGSAIVYEKSGDGTGKDVRTWVITPAGGSFEAVARSAF